MRTVSLSGSLRENVGKKDTKALRKAELVPCVMYGGEEQIHFSLAEKDFKQILFTKECFIINITINGKSYNTILQDVQYHPVNDSVLHADFLYVREDKPITVSIPVTLEGSSVGVIRGGKLKQKMRKVSVCGLAKDIPQVITLDITPLNIGDSIKIKDINIANLKMADIATNVVVEILSTRGAVEEEKAPEAE